MAIRADQIEHFIDRRSADLMRCPATAVSGDAAPLPVFDRHRVSVFRDAALNEQRAGSLLKAVRRLGVSQLRWSLNSLHATGPERARVGVRLDHVDALGRSLQQSDLVYFLDCRSIHPRLVMIEIVDCPVWALVQQELARTPSERAN